MRAFSAPRLLIIACACTAMLLLGLEGPAPAHAAGGCTDVCLPTRTLFVGERFSPTSIRGPIRGVQPQQMMALRGERQGFQLVVKGTQSVRLRGAWMNNSDPALINMSRVDRVQFSQLPSRSTGMGRGAMTVSDGLAPQLETAGAAGYQLVTPNRWAGVYVSVDVPTTAAIGTLSGTVVLVDDQSQKIVASIPVSLSVRAAYMRNGNSTTLPQPGNVRRMQVVMGQEIDRYRQYNGGADNLANQARVVTNMMAAHGISPLTWYRAWPAKSGTAGCPGHANMLNQLASLPSIGTRVLPSGTYGCDERANTADDYSMTRAAGSAARQDDVLNSGTPAFARNVFAHWNAGNHIGSTAAGTVVVKNPFDEPSDRTAAMRRTMQRQVPAANRVLHANMPGVSVMLTSWPRDERKVRRCKRVRGKLRCIAIRLDNYGNRSMWNGGTDDADIWVVPQSRSVGRVLNRTYLSYRWDTRTEYARRLAAIHRMWRKQTWVYNFFSGTRLLPQLTIDAPGTDPQLLLWSLAKDGHRGLYVSNSLFMQQNPAQQAPHYDHPTWGRAYGWGVFAYPSHRPDLGITTRDAEPLSTLRLEGIREGVEDASTVALYRARFGQRSVSMRMSRIFGAPRPLPRKLGNTVWYAHSNFNLAQRMELQRRGMIAQLSVKP